MQKNIRVHKTWIQKPGQKAGQTLNIHHSASKYPKESHFKNPRELKFFQTTPSHLAAKVSPTQ
jgi:hypothetical protein